MKPKPQSLDCPITEAKITHIKNNKACGLDKIYNEYIKASSCIIMPAYVKLFYLILDKGVFPEAWSNSYIQAIYKTDPDNYIPVGEYQLLSA
jgi:hypothetical protein